MFIRGCVRGVASVAFWVLTTAAIGGCSSVGVGSFIDEFTTSHALVRPGDVVTLTWKTHGAEVVELSPFGVVEPNGTRDIPFQDLPTNNFYLTARRGKLQDTRVVTVSRMYGALGGRVLSPDGVPLAVKVHGWVNSEASTDATGAFRFPSMQLPMDVGITNPQLPEPHQSVFFHNVTALDGVYVVPRDSNHAVPHAQFDLTMDHATRPFPSDHWRTVLTVVVAGGRAVGRGSLVFPGDWAASWQSIDAVIGDGEVIDAELITFEADLNPVGTAHWTGFERRGPFRVRAGDVITIDRLVVPPSASTLVKGAVVSPGPAEIDVLARVAGGVLFPLSNQHLATDADGGFTFEVPAAAGVEWAIRASATDHSASATSEAFTLPAPALSVTLPDRPSVAGDGGTLLLGRKESLRWTTPTGLHVCHVEGEPDSAYVDTGNIASTGDLGSLGATAQGDTRWWLTCFSGYPSVDALLLPGSRYTDAEQGLLPGASSATAWGTVRLQP